MTVVQVKTWWENPEQGLGSERGIDEVGVRIGRCNGLVVPWSYIVRKTRQKVGYIIVGGICSMKE